MQGEDPAAAFRQLLQSASKSDAVHDTGEIRITLSKIAMKRRRLGADRLIQGNRGRRFAPAQLHEDSIDRDAVEPRGECSIATERTNRSEYLKKRFLGEIFGLG